MGKIIDEILDRLLFKNGIQITKEVWLNISQAKQAIKEAIKEEINKIDKDSWDKLKELNPDSAEYYDLYTKVDLASQTLSDCLAVIDKLFG